MAESPPTGGLSAFNGMSTDDTGVFAAKHADLARFDGDQAANDSQPAIGPGTSASGS